MATACRTLICSLMVIALADCSRAGYHSDTDAASPDQSASTLDGSPSLERSPSLDWPVLPDVAQDTSSYPPQPDLWLPDAIFDADWGSWYQVDAEECSSFCATLDLANTPSPEGAYCMSGEVRPQSGIDARISFTYGCWTDCEPMLPSEVLDATSDGTECYRPDHLHDHDITDRTVACHCGP